MRYFWLLLTALALAGCQGATPTVEAEDAYPTDAWALWQPGPWLRGANVYQRRVYPDLDGAWLYGPGPFGPPYTQKDFDALAAQGANWVVLSVMGPYSVTPPYRPDPQALNHLTRLVDMAWQADLFVVIAVRSGPGRSEFSILREGLGDWFGPEYLHEEVWTDPEAQAAWADMWRLLARQFRGHPAVVGYNLMVEPNADDIVGVDDPRAFYDRYRDTGYDWNTWYPRLVEAIRAEDPDTPVLVSPLGYASVHWLTYLQPTDAAHVVYAVHMYEPYAYTHQAPAPTMDWRYPGPMLLDQAFEPVWMDQAALDEDMAALAMFRLRADAPVAITETGVMRWEPGAAEFMRDRLEAAERYGINYAVWMWYPAWEALNRPDGDHAFNFRLGAEPRHLREEPNNPLWQTYRRLWARNTVRPSLWGAVPGQRAIPTPGRP
ncbi:MAG: glycoside hydrolase family 5 protein [Chloroflexi bacterium]|nr:glycoside hydrolase family 5 protein [Chloroflexota bacterium]